MHAWGQRQSRSERAGDPMNFARGGWRMHTSAMPRREDVFAWSVSAGPLAAAGGRVRSPQVFGLCLTVNTTEPRKDLAYLPVRGEGCNSIVDGWGVCLPRLVANTESWVADISSGPLPTSHLALKTPRHLVREEVSRRRALPGSDPGTHLHIVACILRPCGRCAGKEATDVGRIHVIFPHARAPSSGRRRGETRHSS
jgi:hypothetical protein